MPESGSKDGDDKRRPRSRRDGIGERAAAALGSFLDYFDARIRLFKLEAAETRGAIIRRIAAAVAGALFLAIAYLCLLTGAIALVAEHFDRPWHLVALVAGGGHLVAGFLLLLAARSKLGRAPFQDSRKEFEKDRKWLNDMRPPES